ncbi:MAG: cupin domain-containing protein [Chloroflexi bacterium]|nr:cupin domain-containing protein [Chloroflexota bacterium]
MRKRGLLVTLGLALGLMLALTSASLASYEGAWPPVKVDLSIQQEGDVFTAVVWIKNEGDFDTGALNVRAQVPKGAKYVDSWAGGGRGLGRGVFDGNDVGWINTVGVKAGGRQGPFIYTFDASALPSDSRRLVLAWVSWGGKVPGSALSNPVSIQNPSPALDVGVGTPPAASPPTLPSVPIDMGEGKALFTNKGCAACHGANAEGGIVGRPLGGRKGQEITVAVRNGKGLMPAFTPVQVSDSELQSIVSFIEGLPSAGGWKWAVAEISAGTSEVIDGPHAHDYAWVFFVVQGSSEISTVDGTRVLSSGEGVFVPARQQHTHRHLPQSRVLAFHLRPADDPPGALHRGRQIFVSDAPIGVSAGVNYQLRVREFSLSPGERLPEAVTVEPNFGYVVEGTLTTRVGDSVSSTEAGNTFTVPLNVRHVDSNEGTTPLRFILADVRSTAAVVAEALRRGGNVILVRHGTTPESILPRELRRPEPVPLDLTDCEAQFNLVEQGIQEGRAIGAAFQRFGIPVGRVVSSPYCRTLDTARLAFGRVDELSATLLRRDYVPMPGVPVPPNWEQRTEDLRRLLATPPPAGTNTAFVTHGDNIRDAVGFEIATGGVAIFKPDGRGGFTLVATVLPNEWGTSP